MVEAHKHYKIEGEKVVRVKKECERCAEFTWMAGHDDRWTCGKCGMTIYKRGRRKVV
ncbi:MAG: 30S ribosomal protein S27ae [Candidatus Heimdallarchaeota archaeon]|nr:30S ribosomal protein S27ae [Candidatus Heimdallarchaeota archaeon]